MKTVRILSDFTAYPANKRRDFRTGEEADVSNDMAEMLVEKGLATETDAGTSTRTATADAAPEKDKSK